MGMEGIIYQKIGFRKLSNRATRPTPTAGLELEALEPGGTLVVPPVAGQPGLGPGFFGFFGTVTHFQPISKEHGPNDSGLSTHPWTKREPGSKREKMLHTTAV